MRHQEVVLIAPCKVLDSSATKRALKTEQNCREHFLKQDFFSSLKSSLSKLELFTDSDFLQIFNPELLTLFLQDEPPVEGREPTVAVLHTATGTLLAEAS